MDKVNTYRIHEAELILSLALHCPVGVDWFLAASLTRRLIQEGLNKDKDDGDDHG